MHHPSTDHAHADGAQPSAAGNHSNGQSNQPSSHKHESAPLPHTVVHHFEEGRPLAVEQQAIEQPENKHQPITRSRGWRPLYEIIDDGSIHSSSENQAAEKVVSQQKPKPRMSFLLGCIISAFISSIVTVTLYEAIMAENEPPAVILHSPLAPEPTVTPAPTATPAPITIFISGSVRNIGVYDLPVGARIEDAILRAGGLLAEADPERVNRAMKLFDGAQIHIPPRMSLDAASDATSGASAPLQLPPPPIGLSGADAPLDAASGDSGDGIGGLIDLNDASLAAIETLPGIGASKAQEIVAGRPYGSVDDLQKVSGIGVKTIDKLREFVTVK